MKQILFLLILIISFSSCKTLKNNSAKKQIENEDVISFNKGTTVFEVYENLYLESNLKDLDTTSQKGKIKFEIYTSEKENILDLAFEKFEEFTEKFPNSKLYHKALFNLALISSKLEYEEDEIKYLNMILSSNANDKEKSGRSGLMSNPYANFKNDASSRLTEIYLQNGNFKKALEFAKLNEKYPYQHFCGNAHASNQIYNAEKYGKIYNGLGNTDKALSYLLPNIFNNGLANNSDLVELTFEILTKNNNLSHLKTEFNNSIDNFYSKERKEGKEEWTNYYIKFLNYEIEIPSWNIGYEPDKEKIKTELIKTIKKSELYIMLNN